MIIAIKIFIGLVAFIHIYILWLEMFAWNTKAKKVFKSIPKDLFSKTTVLVANQGLCNGLLASGLIWTFFIEDSIWPTNIVLFFLGCVTVAGIYGALTASKKIFAVQAPPALLPIILIEVNMFP